MPEYSHSRDPETGKIKYRTEKASFSKKKAVKIFRSKVDAFQEMDQLGVQVDPELTFSMLMDWGLGQDVMSAKASLRMILQGRFTSRPSLGTGKLLKSRH